MLSLLTGTTQTMQHPGRQTRHEPAPRNAYSHALYTTVLQCLHAEYADRPTLKMLLGRIQAGLAGWERMYGSADGVGGPAFMRFGVRARERVGVGEKVFVDGGGRGRKRGSGEMDDEVEDDGSADPAPSRYCVSASSKRRRMGSRTTLVDSSAW